MAKVYNTLDELLARYSTGWAACVRPDGALSKRRQYTWHKTKKSAKATLRRGLVLDEGLIEVSSRIKRILSRPHRKVKS